MGKKAGESKGKTKGKAKNLECASQGPLHTGSLIRRYSVNGSAKEGQTFPLCGGCRVYLGRTAKLVEVESVTGELKVYGVLGERRECPPAPNGTRQTREIVAVKSVAAAHRAFTASGSKLSIRDVRAYGSWTGNAEELEVALAEPGAVFWRPNWSGSPLFGWTRGESLSAQARNVALDAYTLEGEQANALAIALEKLLQHSHCQTPIEKVARRLATKTLADFRKHRRTP